MDPGAGGGGAHQVLKVRQTKEGPFQMYFMSPHFLVSKSVAVTPLVSLFAGLVGPVQHYILPISRNFPHPPSYYTGSMAGQYAYLFNV